MALNLAGDLAERHDVELVSVRDRIAEPMHGLPLDVPVRTLVDDRCHQLAGVGVAGPCTVRPPDAVEDAQDSTQGQQSLYADLELARYVRSVRDGVLIGMQPA
ncbi:MAG: glycosyltransferase family 4 protein, partial [Actinomycetota bacterium]|nr:glycosyltransferase family 4 protein [Actinomycetota bacterium]